MKAVVLLSGGLDSATTLYYAKAKGYKTSCLTFDYGQRHRKEVFSARRLAHSSGSEWRLLKIKLPWKGSSLLDKEIKLPEGRQTRSSIPSTYVPARNIIFLSFAVSYAESIGAETVFIGANQIDYSGYPDCRSSFLKAFEDVIRKGTRSGTRHRPVIIKAPLINKTKVDIVMEAVRLKVPIKYTWSCYKGSRQPCQRCDSCLIRRNAFRKAGLKDPLSDERQ